MSDKRQKTQFWLAFGKETKSEAPRSSGEGSETLTAKCISESPAKKNSEQLMEEVCGRENCLRAWKRVKSNRVVLASTA